MNSVMTILRDISKKLFEVEKYLDSLDIKYGKDLENLEIKVFFIVRHQEMPRLARAQEKAIHVWEPRIARLIEGMDWPRYINLRKWLGIGKLGIKGYVPVTKVNKVKDQDYKARVVMDLRDDNYKGDM